MSEIITLAHGSGGTQMKRLIDELLTSTYGNDLLLTGDDAAVLELSELSDPGARLAFTTDSYVVTPHFFPGGNIGQLAIFGTVNDLATSGARPLYLSLGFILEEGFALSTLEQLATDIAAAALHAGVQIVTGDTKVVERGKGDGIYINCSGVGVIAPGRVLSGHNCKPGDAILLSGTLGDHGITIVSTREGLSFEAPIQSDAAPLSELVQAVIDAAPHARCFRDPTRGGLASTLNELARQSGTCMLVDESAVPVKDAVRGASDMLGYDLYHLANEGKMVAIVPAEEADRALEAMRRSPHGYGEDAAIIGRVVALDEPNLPRSTLTQAFVQTALGTLRVMDELNGEQLPRIC
ncbi:MAG: hydrogenase expression/formation protein HypE [Coriobacteriales bacterium]|jgi:hydrogenase expression/formation protein HypE|nr:hydrogenase expression/formation protein HypE [Coriobacteriales bacterium]